jgi:hypothetical protein
MQGRPTLLVHAAKCTSSLFQFVKTKRGVLSMEAKRIRQSHHQDKGAANGAPSDPSLLQLFFVRLAPP